MTVRLLINPRSGGGRTERRLAALERAARSRFDPIEVVLTTHPGHAATLAATPGVERLLCVGGDGTVHEVIQGLATMAPEDRPILAIIPAGTGCDLARTLGVPRDVERALDLAVHGEVRRVDWLTVEMGDRVRYSINVTGFGLSGAVVQAVNRSSKRLGGTLSFGLATASATLRWTAPEVEITWDGPAGPGAWQGPIASVFVANGQYCGGGMWVAPEAALDDGLAELVLLPAMSTLRAIRYAPRLYDGRIAQVPGVLTASVQSIHARSSSSSPVPIDTDGEQPGSLPLRLEVEPSALPMVGSWPQKRGRSASSIY